MLDKILYILLGAILLVGGYVFYKSKGARTFILTALMTLLVFTGIVSGFRLNTYYTAKGGIIGQITGAGIYKENEVTIQETTQIDFEFTNVILTKNESDKYSAKFSTDKTLKLEDNEYYQILVNGEPAQLIYSDKSSVIAKYTYLFQSKELDGENYKEITIDTMTISFGFYGNYSNIICEISGKETASLWQSYFEKNNFKISIVKVNEIEINKQNSELKTITIYANDEVIEVVKIKKGSDFVLPELVEVEGFIFNHFELNGEKTTKITNINEDISVIAKLSKLCDVTVSLYYNSLESNSGFVGIYQIASGTTLEEVFEILQNDSVFKAVTTGDRAITGHKVIGFTTQKYSNEIELDYVIESDVTIYCVWESLAYPITIISNNASYKIGELEQHSDFTLKSLYTYNLTLTFLSSNTDEVFSHYSLYFTNYPNKTKTINSETTSFSIKQIYNSLHNNYPTGEYVPPEYRVEFETVGDLVVEIHTKVYERPWTEDYTTEELEQISYYEEMIANMFGIYYDESHNSSSGTSSDKVIFPIEERKFLGDVYGELTSTNPEDIDLTTFEIKQELLTLFGGEILTEEPEFLDYLILYFNFLTEKFN